MIKAKQAAIQRLRDLQHRLDGGTATPDQAKELNSLPLLEAELTSLTSRLDELLASNKLPSGWSLHTDPDGEQYFKNHTNMYATYEDPRIFKVPIPVSLLSFIFV